MLFKKNKPARPFHSVNTVQQRGDVRHNVKLRINNNTEPDSANNSQGSELSLFDHEPVNTNINIGTLQRAQGQGKLLRRKTEEKKALTYS